jgi:hypothetical protein
MEAYEVSSETLYIFHIKIQGNRETRHPNVVLYLGLARAPDPDGRIFIISEFIENGLSNAIPIRIHSHSL